MKKKLGAVLGKKMAAIAKEQAVRFMPKQKPGKSKQDYKTPADFIAAVKTRFKLDDFSVDLAAHKKNKQCAKYFGDGGLQSDSFKVKWHKYAKKKHAWLNPPFGNIRKWVKKCVKESQKGAKILFLVPASVGANWFRDNLKHTQQVLFLSGRLKFVAGQPGYPKDCMLIVFDKSKSKGMPIVWNWRTGQAFDL